MVGEVTVNGVRFVIKGITYNAVKGIVSSAVVVNY